MVYAGDGDLFFPYKRIESTLWLYRSKQNSYIRSQRMVNEWGIGFINNRFRVFLGRWPFEPELFPIAYQPLQWSPIGSSIATYMPKKPGRDIKKRSNGHTFF